MKLIRHGKKAWKNGRPDHDPPLINGDDIKKLRNQLTEVPEYIVCSPFLRCRQTAEILSGGNIPIIIDSNLREYLGNWKFVSINFETLKNIQGPIIETYAQFENRVKNCKYSGNIWIVSHGLTIREICKAWGKPPIYPDEASFIEI